MRSVCEHMYAHACVRACVCACRLQLSGNPFVKKRSVLQPVRERERVSVVTLTEKETEIENAFDVIV